MPPGERLAEDRHGNGELQRRVQVLYQSGAPLNRIGYPAVRLDPRGYTGRMPSIWEADLTLGYPIVVVPATVTVQVYVFNLFNNQAPIYLYNSWEDVPPDGYPATIYDPNQPQTDPYYGYVFSRQHPRLLRAALKISF